jgi:hypothetical protein
MPKYSSFWADKEFKEIVEWNSKKEKKVINNTL